MAQNEVGIIYTLKDLASAGLRKIKEAINSVGEATVDAGKQVEKTSKTLDQSGKIGAIAAVGFGALAGAMVAVGKSMVSSAIQAEQVETAFRVMMGSAEAAKEKIEELKTFSAATPFEYKDTVQYARQLYAIGVNAENLVPTLRILGDVSSSLGLESMPFIVKAYGDVVAAGRLTNQELRQFTNSGVPLLQILADKFGVTGGEIRKMAEEGTISLRDVQEAMITMNSEGGRAFNMMEAQSKTLGGQLSNLQDSVGFLSTEMGQTLTPAVGVVASGLKSLVDFFRSLSTETKNFIGWSAALVTGLFGLLSVVGLVGLALPVVSVALVAMNIPLAAVGIGIAAAFSVVAIVAFRDKLTFVKDLFNDTLLAVNPLLQVLRLLANVFTLGLSDGVIKFGKGLFDVIKNLKMTTKESKNSKDSVESSVGAFDRLRKKISEVNESFLNFIKSISSFSVMGKKIQLIGPDQVKTIDDAIKKERELRAEIDRKSKSKQPATSEKALYKNKEKTLSLDTGAIEATGKKQKEKLLSPEAQAIDATVKKQKEKPSSPEDRATLDESVKALFAKTEDSYFKERLKNIDKLAFAQKQLGTYTIESTKAMYVELMNEEYRTFDQKKELMERLEQLEIEAAFRKQERDQYLLSEEQKYMQSLADERARGINAEMQMSKIVLDAARAAGDQKLSLAESVANGMLDFAKRALIAEVDALATKWAIEATGNLARSYGLDPFAWALLGQAAAASAGVRAALSGIQLAEGGIVMPRPGGVRATVAEAGAPEAVIPLNTVKAERMMGMGGGSREVIILTDDGSQLAKGVYLKQTELIQQGRLGKRS